MNEREKIIRLWFDMWIKKADLGIDNIFTDDVVYTESWSPKYEVIFFFLNIGILLICIAGTHFRMLLSKNLPLH